MRRIESGPEPIEDEVATLLERAERFEKSAKNCEHPKSGRPPDRDTAHMFRGEAKRLRRQAAELRAV